jgi:leucyl-tRNA synthetase
MGPLEKSKPWKTKGLQGCYRFLSKVWRLFHENSKSIKVNCSTKETDILLHQTIKKVTEDIENLRFNTSVSQLMIFTNHLTSLKNLDYKTLHVFVQLLNPFAPHISEELNQTILKNKNKPLSSIKWPEYDDSLLEEDTYTIAVQINGKMRGTIDVKSDLQESEITDVIISDSKLGPYFAGMDIIKTIYIPNKLFNFILKKNN